jgi:hypothetical protein
MKPRTQKSSAGGSRSYRSAETKRLLASGDIRVLARLALDPRVVAFELTMTPARYRR